MKQNELIYNYNYDCRPHFNDRLFERRDEDITQAIYNVVKSCERKSFFEIKVINFEVIDDYDEVNHILWEYEDSIINKRKPKSPEELIEEMATSEEDEDMPKNQEDETEAAPKRASSSSNSKKVNQFEFINLKDSDIRLIRVTYYISTTEKKNGFVHDTVVTYIVVPRIVDKFYFRINGNVYSAMYQVCDASTYNNSAAQNAKKATITFKTVFMPIRIYRFSGSIKDINGDTIKCTYFLANMFKKSNLVMKYLFAKMGFYGAISFLKAKSVNLIRAEDIDKIDMESNYAFPVREMYIIVSKYLFDSIQVIQSVVYTIHSVCTYMKSSTYDEFFDTTTWIKALGSEFASKNLDAIYDKGLSILNSLEFIYDIGTKEKLRLDSENKSDIYRVIRWMMYEFNALRMKDNLDVSIKKVIDADYIGYLYANRVANGIYRISDMGDKVTLKNIRGAIQTQPMYLLNAISKCQLVNYKNNVNDLDSITALKFTYKGVTGIGETANAIPRSYRSIHPSHLGRIDLDASSASDPGISGSLCPLLQLDDGYFTNFREPCTWESELSKTISKYNSINGRSELCRLIKDEKLSTKPENNDIKLQVSNECASINKSLISFARKYNESTEEVNYKLDIFGDDIMIVEYI